MNPPRSRGQGSSAPRALSSVLLLLVGVAREHGERPVDLLVGLDLGLLADDPEAGREPLRRDARRLVVSRERRPYDDRLEAVRVELRLHPLLAEDFPLLLAARR